jgi:hypothetical protein
VRILVNSDKNILVDMQFKRFVRGETNRILSRFKDKLTRVEFHLRDVNSHKFGTRDKRCLVEARPAGHQSVTVTAAAATVESAVGSALSKMRRALETFFARIGSRRTADRRAASRSLRRSASRKKAVFEESRAHQIGEIGSRKASAPTRASSRKRATATRPSVAKATASRRPASGRSPKKKGIYQARRKSWPKR